MDERIYHGNITPDDFAHDLMGAFNRGNLSVQRIGSGDQVAVQIYTSQSASSGGRTAITVSLQSVEDGVAIKVGQQAWLGVAASLGHTALLALKNPFSVLGRLDDLAQDIENLSLTDEIWKVIGNTAGMHGIGTELSERLRRTVCDYCNSANPVGESRCIACGAPLGNIQPTTCLNCGFVIQRKDKNCPNCGRPL